MICIKLHAFTFVALRHLTHCQYDRGLIEQDAVI